MNATQIQQIIQKKLHMDITIHNPSTIKKTILNTCVNEMDKRNESNTLTWYTISWYPRDSNYQPYTKMFHHKPTKIQPFINIYIYMDMPFVLPFDERHGKSTWVQEHFPCEIPQCG
jgi:hypothetical protein